MEKPKLEFPEAVGKLVAELAVYDDALHGREVLGVCRTYRIGGTRCVCGSGAFGLCAAGFRTNRLHAVIR
jgi:hypothetical protein